MKKLFKKLPGLSLFSFKTPDFWDKDGLIPQLLLPFSVLYFLLKKVGSSKVETKKFPLKVICIGNAILGGAGKTPAAIAVHNEIKKINPDAKIVFVTTGYKAKLYGPVLVDLNNHKATDVGDEAILLADKGQVIICKERVKAFEHAASQGFQYVILDDGLHDRTIHKDISFLVIDGKYGFGNEMVFPSGPLRDRLDFAVKGTDQIILIGKDEKNSVDKVNKFGKKDFPVISAYIDSINEIDENLVYLAFAGIGRPEKFFDMLRNEMKLFVAETVKFPDHHIYDNSDFEYLNELAKQQKAKLITTEKDFVKLPESFASEVVCVKIELKFEGKEIQDILNKL